MYILYLTSFSIALVLAVLLTALVRDVALRWGVVDVPSEPRKLHTVPTPLLGGVALYIAFTITLVIFFILNKAIIIKDIRPTAILGLIIGGFVLMVGGYLDDRYHLKPTTQFIWPVVAALVAVASGVLVRGVTNPLGGTFHFDSVPLLPAVLGFVWLLGMMYTTKLLDGLDGLATGVGAIGSLIIFGLTQFTPFYQPSVGLLAVMLAGATLGFLIWNWHPAKIFLGEGGSLYIGFILGVLAVISGAKIATALLVMGIPILDVAWVIVRRLFWEKKSLAAADRQHLHYRLLDVGLSHRQAVIVLYSITLSFGLVSLFLRTQGKLIALFTLLIVMILLGTWVVWRYKTKQKRPQF